MVRGVMFIVEVEGLGPDGKRLRRLRCWWWVWFGGVRGGWGGWCTRVVQVSYLVSEWVRLRERVELRARGRQQRSSAVSAGAATDRRERTGHRRGAKHGEADLLRKALRRARLYTPIHLANVHLLSREARLLAILDPTVILRHRYCLRPVPVTVDGKSGVLRKLTQLSGSIPSGPDWLKGQ